MSTGPLFGLVAPWAGFVSVSNRTDPSLIALRILQTLILWQNGNGKPAKNEKKVVTILRIFSYLIFPKLFTVYKEN